MSDSFYTATKDSVAKQFDKEHYAHPSYREKHPHELFTVKCPRCHREFDTNESRCPDCNLKYNSDLNCFQIF